MILVADGGSTSCDWIALNSNTHKFILKFKTKGLNPVYSSVEEMMKVIVDAEELVQFKNEIKAIYFFGAGCNSKVFSNKLKTVFKSFFAGVSKIKINGDIQGAVYACTNVKSVVGILGTGSNICYYDGATIRTNIESLGYSLMDDGAGSALGRLLLRAYFYKKMPSILAKRFSENFNLDPDYIKENIYHKPFAGRFLASHAKFVFDNLNESFSEQLLVQNLENYFDTHVVQFKKELENDPIHFVGSVAFLSKNILAIMCNKYGYTLGNVIKSPIHNLAENLKYYI